MQMCKNTETGEMIDDTEDDAINSAFQKDDWEENKQF